MRYQCICFALFSLLFVQCIVTATLFINQKQNIQKVRAYQQLQQTATTAAVETERIEERISSLVKRDVVLSLQSLFSIMVVVNLIAETMSAIPIQFQRRLRGQCCVTIILLKLVDLFRNFALSEYNIRDSYLTEDLLLEAKKEIGVLSVGPLSSSIAYYAICLASNCPKGCIIPFLVSELPNLLRILSIVFQVSMPEQVQSLTGILFPEGGLETITEFDRNDAETIATARLGIDGACESVAAVLEVGLLGATLLDLVRFRSQQSPIRGFRDLCMLAVRILLIQNYFVVRTKSIASSLNQKDVISALQSSPAVQTLLTLPAVQQALPSLQRYLQLAGKLWSASATRGALRELLGKHNISVLERAVGPVGEQGTDDDSATTSSKSESSSESRVNHANGSDRGADNDSSNADRSSGIRVVDGRSGDSRTTKRKVDNSGETKPKSPTRRKSATDKKKKRRSGTK